MSARISSQQRVVVVGVVRRELVVPDDLAGLRPQRQHRGGVEVVARPRLRRPRRRIADAPVHEVELRIVRAGDPGRAAADLPRIGVLRPGLVALLAARRNGVAAPQLLAGLGVPAVDEAADAELGARDAGDQHAVGDQRRDRHASSRPSIRPPSASRSPCRSWRRARPRRRRAWCGRPCRCRSRRPCWRRRSTPRAASRAASRPASARSACRSRRRSRPSPWRWSRTSRRCR